MAKYTITLGEYLKNNTLPEIFGEIENFSELFILEYIDRELGYETTWLFQQKLLGRASLVCPLYIERIGKLKVVEDKLFTQLQMHRSEKKQGTYNLGEQQQKVTNLPFNESNVEPNTVSENGAVVNTDTIETNYTEDLRPSDLQLQYNELLDTKKFIIRRLLNEFSDLFMKIY